MSERKKGAAGVSLLFRLTDSTTGAAKSGIDVTTLKLQYERPGEAASAATSLTLLAALTTAWTAFGAKEVDATNSKGVYRVDAPDAAFAGTPDEVTISISGTGVETSTRLIDLMGVDAHNAAESIISRGPAAAQAGGASTITLDVAGPTVDGANVGHIIQIASGTGAGGIRQIVSYVGSTKVATVNRAWSIAPDSTSVFVIYKMIFPVLDASNFVFQSTGTGAGQINASGGKVALTAAGLDAVVAETGINARQALALMLASTCGDLSGAAGTTITILAPDAATTRIVATVDANGNRSAVTLLPPA